MISQLYNIRTSIIIMNDIEPLSVYSSLVYLYNPLIDVARMIPSL